MFAWNIARTYPMTTPLFQANSFAARLSVTSLPSAGGPMVYGGAESSMRRLMLSAVTYLADPADPDAIDRLADTLSVLVSGVAGGLIGDAVIVAGAESEAVAAVAEATGATLVLHRGGAAFAAGARAARRDWVLCLEAGDVPAEGWIRTLDRFVGTARPDIGVGRLHRPAAGWLGLVRNRVEAWVGTRRPRAGDVVRRDVLRSGATVATRLKVRPLIARIDRA